MLRDATMRTFLDLAERAGILAEVNRSEMSVLLTDGKRILFRSADNPDRLRGPNLGWFYLDEAAMMPPEVWLIMIGRLRETPARRLATSTPRGKNWLYTTFTQPGSFAIVRSSSRENQFLPSAFVQTLETSYTARFARQEIEGDFIDDVEGALWKHTTIDGTRVASPPQLVRVVVAVDPSGTATGDAAGIIVAGISADRQGYILEDTTIQASPDQWAKVAVGAYHRHRADRLVAEVNYGGEMVRQTIRTVDPHIAYTAVHASRGKAIRAEPIAALYEQGKVHHVGTFAALEDELTSWVPGMASPNRMDALVWALTELLLGSGNAPAPVAGGSAR